MGDMVRDQRPSGGCVNCGAGVRTRKANGWVCTACDRLLTRRLPEMSELEKRYAFGDR